MKQPAHKTKELCFGESGLHRPFKPKLFSPTKLRMIESEVNVKFLFVSISMALGFFQVVLAADLTCYNRISGDWQFGTAPEGCNVSPLVNTGVIRLQYSPVIFDTQTNRNLARKKYISAMLPIIRGTSEYYIQKRNPGASAAEIKGFVDGVLALANQESVWTHYRSSGGIIHYMRGDFKHGHGLMQLDDRSHRNALNQGKGVDLVYNIIYGLDIYYAAWIRSARASCVSSANNFRDRARAAWSAYNGGPGSLCRWANGSDGDDQYYDKFRGKRWLQFVDNVNAKPSLDIICLAEGKRPCSIPNQPLSDQLALTLVSEFAAEPNISTGGYEENFSEEQLLLSNLPNSDFVSLTDLLNEIARLRKCEYSTCNFRAPDQRTYRFEVSQALQKRILQLVGLVRKDGLKSETLKKLGRSLIGHDDGFVQKAALRLLMTQERSNSNRDSIIQNILQGSDAELIPLAFEALKQYESAWPNDLDQQKINREVMNSLKHGSPFVAIAVSKKIRVLLNQTNAQLFRSYALSLAPNSIVRLNLLREIDAP